MFCSNCGSEASGNFCSRCGARLQGEATDSGRVEAPASGNDWFQLARRPDVQDRIAMAATRAKHPVTVEQFLGTFERAAPGVPLRMVMSGVESVSGLFGRLGLNVRKSMSEGFDSTPEDMFVAVLCALAAGGKKLIRIQAIGENCVVEAFAPEYLTTKGYNLMVTLRPKEGGTVVEAATKISGAAYDWGWSKRQLRNFFADIRDFAEQG